MLSEAKSIQIKLTIPVVKAETVVTIQEKVDTDPTYTFILMQLYEIDKRLQALANVVDQDPVQPAFRRIKKHKRTKP